MSKNQLYILLFLLASISTSQAQDTIYLDPDWKETLDPEKAEYFKIFERDEENPDQVLEKTFYISGKIKEEAQYSSYKKEILEGTRKTWKKSGQLWLERDYKKGKLDGPFLSYWENGRPKRKDFYKKGKLKEGKTWDELGNELEWYPMQEKPAFPGGQGALAKYIKENAKKPAGIAGGRVVVGFVIDLDGSITDVKIEETSSMDLNWTAYSVVKDMPAWEPGRHDGEKVRVKYSLPLKFE